MPDLAYIVRSLTGAWRLAKLDRRGLDDFDMTVDGFWRSFFACVVALPAFVVVYFANNLSEISMGGLVSHGLIYLIDWLTLPVVAVLLTKLLGLSHRYVALVVATNWAAVLQFAVFAVVSVVVGILPDTMQASFFLAGVAVILFYDWFVIRTSLETSIGIALGIVVIDLVLGIVISGVLRGG